MGGGAPQGGYGQVPAVGQGRPGEYYGRPPPPGDARGWVTRADGTKVSPKFEVELNQMYARCQNPGGNQTSRCLFLCGA